MTSYEFDKANSIGVMSVATNIYLEYWKDMVRSADLVTNADDNVCFFVFTDKPYEIKDFIIKCKNVSIQVFEIPSYRWPEATLLRYEIFNTFFDEMKTDHLMHLDADMIINSNPWKSIKSQVELNYICLVQHPGFWRPEGIERLYLYARNPKLAYQDLFMQIKVGGRGAWDRNPNSQAFVNRKKRIDYFCGGAWFGTRDSIKGLVQSLAQQVSIDLKNNVIASWHDESHINKWATENNFGTVNPEYCFDETYLQVKMLKPKIIAVRKLQKTR
jgi:histo-blood group ABO system transferase